MLARFSVNERTDLYPNDIALAKAYALVLKEELEQVISEGCDYIQFDEPVWTENVNETLWAAQILNEIIDQLKDFEALLIMLSSVRPLSKYPSSLSQWMVFGKFL